MRFRILYLYAMFQKSSTMNKIYELLQRNSQDLNQVETGTLMARPDEYKDEYRGEFSGQTSVPTGLHALKLGKTRDGLIYVPKAYQANKPSPLVLMLHGASGTAKQSIDLLQKWADSYGTILVAPDSRGRTWDLILGEYGPDVTFINHALEQVFEQYAIDKDKIAVAGFSDGASYALSLGLANGELFSHIIAFSPGFSSPSFLLGAPQVFISHGIEDRVLLIDRCSRQLVKRLKKQGYEMVYREFNEAHSVPDEIVKDAFIWFLSRSSKETIPVERSA